MDDSKLIKDSNVSVASVGGSFIAALIFYLLCVDFLHKVFKSKY